MTVVRAGPEQGSGDAEGGWEGERLRSQQDVATH